MTNEELFARQFALTNQAIYGIAMGLRQVLCQLPVPLGTVELTQHPAVGELDRVMQSYNDSLLGLAAMVQKQNSSAGIILPQ